LVHFCRQFGPPGVGLSAPAELHCPVNPPSSGFPTQNTADRREAHLLIFRAFDNLARWAYGEHFNAPPAARYSALRRAAAGVIVAQRV